jgi:hypothetical protein
MHHDYDSLVDALQDLRAEGYELDFNMQQNCIECKSLDETWQPREFTIVKTYRFEGNSNPDDNSVLFAVETSDGKKGTLLDAYGAYSEALDPEMIHKFRVDYDADQD